MKRKASIGMLGASFVALVAAAAPAAAQQVAIDNNDIGGVVRSAKGPEAGVWVIAETRDLPTKYVKIVVTDDQGRYVLPDLPARSTYDVWVRGYGLVDSMKVKSTPGKNLNLTAIVAPNRAAAAQVYP
ncbi:MAG: carboxypeptidase-like regulatory domain-containing protein, partial [Vicinamibacterales bacterium]